MRKQLRPVGKLYLLLLVIPSFAHAWDYDERYLEYRRWGIHVNNVMYAPAYAKKQEGVYDIDTRPMRGINFGISYTFRRDHELSYYTGLDLDYIPFYYFYYEVPAKEFPPGTPVIGRDYSKWINDHNVLTIPIGINWKSPVQKKKYTNFTFSLSGDIRFHIIQPGGMSMEFRRGDVSYFYIYGDSKDINILSPTINLAAGMQWLTKIAIFSINLNIQKGIVPYLWGEYSFYNLQQSPDTKGIYRVRADYVGVDIGITPKKWGRKS